MHRAANCRGQIHVLIKDSNVKFEIASLSSSCKASVWWRWWWWYFVVRASLKFVLRHTSCVCRACVCVCVCVRSDTMALMSWESERRIDEINSRINTLTCWTHLLSDISLRAIKQLRYASRIWLMHTGRPLSLRFSMQRAVCRGR